MTATDIAATDPDEVFPALDHRYAREAEGLFVEWQPAAVAAPSLLVLNTSLANELGLDAAALESPSGVAVLAGNRTPVGAKPVAMAYAGHQFGGYSPRLGDGRALLLGEVVTAHGHRDIHLKGSGRTPFARGGDGRAAVGPMLREYLIAEAMHALGIPTTRALAVVATGERIMRDGSLPGAVLTRVASSHLRVGSFEFAARTGDAAVMDRLVDHAIARHYPDAAHAANPALALLHSVIESQASLVANWMLVGFIHGVMNTDNMTISGESIDFGPCAFMDRYDPRTVYSSIDHGGRYAFGNQPNIAQWNLARLAETLLSRIDSESDKAVAIATEALHQFPDRFHHRWEAGMRAKLGLRVGADDDRQLFDSWLALLGEKQADYTSSFRALSVALRGSNDAVHALLGDDESVVSWLTTWQTRIASEANNPADVADAMDSVNPLYIPRNHHVERVLEAATLGDLTPFHELLDVVTHPFAARPEWAAFAEPAPESFSRYHQTFCGT
jgi:serine/tyrosine/threonine adenylyltransferase